MFLYGAGGHARVIIDIILSSTDFIIEGVFDDFSSELSINTIPLVNVLPNNNTKNDLIISIGNNKLRKKIAQSQLANYLTVLDRKSIISNFNVHIDVGSVVMANVTVNTNVKIGKHCIINTSASIDHDCKIDDYVHISPGAVLCGGITVGEGSQVGANSVIVQNKSIGKWASIGAGSVIIKNVPDYAIVVGNPGKIIGYNEK